MKTVTWDDEVSCCGGHRNGKAEFDDGEVLYVNDACGAFAVRAVLDGDVNTASKRVKGGQQVGLSRSEFDQVLSA